MRHLIKNLCWGYANLVPHFHCLGPLVIYMHVRRLAAACQQILHRDSGFLFIAIPTQIQTCIRFTEQKLFLII